ncbi:MAG: DMT family transporter [Promethearchaeota archaeon]
MSGELAAIGMAVSFSLAFVITRKIDRAVNPPLINAVRSLIGLITFIIGALWIGHFLDIFKLNWQLWIWLSSSILFTVVIGDTAYFQAQKFIGPTIATAITTTSPFFTLILAIAFLGRSFHWLILISAVIIVVGVIIMTHPGKKDLQQKNNNTNINEISECEGNDLNKNQLNEKFQPKNEPQTKNKPRDELHPKSFTIGLFWASIASITWAIGTVITDYSINASEMVLNLGTQTVTVAYIIRYFFACLVMCFWVIFNKRAQKKKKKRQNSKKSKKTRKTVQIWVLLLISAIIGTSIGSYLYGAAIRVAGATFLAIMNVSLPLFTIPFDYFINREKLSFLHFIGMMITLSGVVLLIVVN